LAVVAEASGLDKAALSRLENGKFLNPTMSTLWRYARAVGVELKLDAHVVAAGA
jgi:transcriptional regulator with XRE-family HTH domain